MQQRLDLELKTFLLAFIAMIDFERCRKTASSLPQQQRRKSTIKSRCHTFAKTSQGFFSSCKYQIKRQSLELFAHIDTLKPFSVHSPLADFDHKLQEMVEIHKQKSEVCCSASLVDNSAEILRKTSCSDAQFRCSQIVQPARRQSRTVRKRRAFMFREAIEKNVPTHEDEQSEVAEQMIHNCLKDQQQWTKLLNRLGTKFKAPQPPLNPEDKKHKVTTSTLQSPRSKAEYLGRGTMEVGQMAPRTRSVSPNLRIKSRNCVGQGSALQTNKNDYFFMSKHNRVLNMQGMMSSAAVPSDGKGMHKYKKYVKSYILKKQQAKSYFLRIAGRKQIPSTSSPRD